MSFIHRNNLNRLDEESLSLQLYGPVAKGQLARKLELMAIQELNAQASVV